MNNSCQTTVSREQLVTKLLERKGAMPITFLAKTEAKARKSPFGKIMKIKRVNAMVNFHYDAGVLRRLEKEGKSPEDFKRGESWHEPVLHEGKLTPFCQHKTDKNKLYLRVMILNDEVDGVKFYGDCGVLSAEQVEPYLQKSKSYANQGLDEPLRFAAYSVDNILEVAVDGEKLVVQQ